MYEGIWWPAVDEGISVKSMFLGKKAPAEALSTAASNATELMKKNLEKFGGRS